jgi:hypothetical protein
MRRHKAVARIFLFLSIFNFAFAGLAQTPTMHEMRVDLETRAEDVTEASERGHTQSEELPEWSGSPSMAGHLHSRLDTPSAQSATTSAADLEKKKFFNKELTRRMKEYLVLGIVAGIFTGVTNGIQKQIIGTVSPGAYVFTSPPSPSCQHLNGVGHKPILTMVHLSQTVGRAVKALDEHLQDQEDLMSHSLSNMGDEDLQMLSIISRRMLNRLDYGSGF